MNNHDDKSMPLALTYESAYRQIVPSQTGGSFFVSLTRNYRGAGDVNVHGLPPGAKFHLQEIPGGDLALNKAGAGRPVVVDRKGKLKALVKGPIYRDMLDPRRRMGGRRPVRVDETDFGYAVHLGELWLNFVRDNPAASGRALVPAEGQVLHGEILAPGDGETPGPDAIGPSDRRQLPHPR
jgi:hypothetical protein